VVVCSFIVENFKIVNLSFCETQSRREISGGNFNPKNLH
jgi:hypothetical protein